MFKKLHIILFICILLLCGCTKNNNRITIQFASWGSKSEIDILKPILENFEKENPDIKIDFMHIPQNYYQKIHLLFASNTAPDVIFINNLYLPVYAHAKMLEELEIDDIFYSQAVNALSWENKHYAIPRDVSNLVIYYNKNLFDKHNIAYPEEDWTFEDFLKIAKKLTDKNSFGISFEEDVYFYLPYIMSMGGGILPEQLNKNETQNAIKFYSDLRLKYNVAPKKYQSASATMAQMFLQQKLGMYLSGRWMVPKFREDCSFDWDIQRFPRGDKGSIVPLDASGWAISKSSKHKTEAIRFIKYLSSKESIEKFVSSGLIVPARKDVSIIDSQKPKNAKIFLDIITQSKPTPVTVNYREIVDKVNKEMENKF